MENKNKLQMPAKTEIVVTVQEFHTTLINGEWKRTEIPRTRTLKGCIVDTDGTVTEKTVKEIACKCLQKMQDKIRTRDI